MNTDHHMARMSPRPGTKFFERLDDATKARILADLTPDTPTPANPLTIERNRQARLVAAELEARLSEMTPAWTSETGRPALRKGRIARRPEAQFGGPAQ